MSDVVEQAKAALEGVTEGPWLMIPDLGNQDAAVISEGERASDLITVGGHTFHPGYSVAVDLRQPDAEFIAAARELVPELLAEVERLHSWDGLMSLVDEHYPEDIFPTEEDNDGRDPGPRIISLLRTVDGLRSTLFLIREARIDYDAALRNREHAGVAAQRFVDAVVSALDGSDR